jgi:hypothetical protein
MSERVYNNAIKNYLAQKTYGYVYEDLGSIEKDSIDRAYDQFMSKQMSLIGPVADSYSEY